MLEILFSWIMILIVSDSTKKIKFEIQKATNHVDHRSSVLIKTIQMRMQLFIFVCKIG